MPRVSRQQRDHRKITRCRGESPGEGNAQPVLEKYEEAAVGEKEVTKEKSGRGPVLTLHLRANQPRLKEKEPEK